mmetsp:Transcript_15591/g.23581  ORF Transcript_15591/g.23581 Transcript_15591/m.23581 type:complete len:158 (-) Transcript_15591:3068-3541(-)|eukprot:scaffold3287_cov135-Skeletonema_dohrnii-CCMP3373.AAC.4
MTALSFLRAVVAVVLLLQAAVAASNQSVAAAEQTPRGWSLAPSANIAFLPRGGGAISFRKGKSTKTQEPVATASEEQSVEDDTDEEISSDEADSSDDTPPASPFQKAYQEEVSEIKKSQEFLRMQQRRREMDKTWLDKGITSVIELFENIFRWEVID